jgi:alpha-tubulin suppressor-like RCC1 family protein
MTTVPRLLDLRPSTAILGLAALACGEAAIGPKPIDVLPASVSIHADSVMVLEGETRQLVATVRDTAGREMTASVHWSTNRPDVAAVSESGLVRAGQLGTAFVVAAVGDLADSVAVDVRVVFRSVSAGATHTCAVSAAGNAYCWGQNREGRLGDGTKVTRSAPIRVASDHRFFELSAGRQFTCGRTDRGAHCWGSNRSGQLGSADKHDAVVPVPVIRGQGLASVSAYAIHACAVALELGIAYCWGADWSGQLGNGDDDWHLGPHPVAGGLRFRTLAAGWLFACGITTDDVIWCWGGNDAGQLGSADDGDDCQFLSGQPLPCATTPTAMPAARTYSSITAGSIHACALTPAGRAYCWGRNAEGQLGNGTTTGTSSPVPVAGTLAFVALTAGDHHTCGLTTDGTAYCWGDNHPGAGR